MNVLIMVLAAVLVAICLGVYLPRRTAKTDPIPRIPRPYSKSRLPGPSVLMFDLEHQVGNDDRTFRTSFEAETLKRAPAPSDLANCTPTSKDP